MESNDNFDVLGVLLALELANSAASAPPVQLKHYHYEVVCRSLDHILDPTFSLRHIHRSHVEDLVPSMCGLSFNYRNVMMRVTGSMKCETKNALMEDVPAKQGSRKVVKDGL